MKASKEEAAIALEAAKRICNNTDRPGDSSAVVRFIEAAIKKLPRAASFDSDRIRKKA